MRPLTLHVSALSDAEYDLYTNSLDDLTTDDIPHHLRDDAHYERTTVGVREVRAWLRGRYSNLPASDIDAILGLFCRRMLPSDTLTGGQFFAALRLVVHAASGKGVDRTLAFVQASPGPARPLSPPRKPVQAPPSHPDRLPPTTTTSQDTNPFTRRSAEHARPPPAEPDAIPVIPYQRPGKLSQNPFLARDNANPAKLPPLPPRKPSLLPAPPRIRPSEVTPSPITFTPTFTTPSAPPLIPTKPTHLISPLMRQSLEASKHAQSMKRAQEQLDCERVLQVLKTTSSSSSVGATGTRTRSLSPSKQVPNGRNGSASASASGGSDDAPPLPLRRKQSLSASTASSALSMEQVASASLPSPIGTSVAPSRPPLPSRDAVHEHAGVFAVAGTGAGIPPPMHPHRRSSASTSAPTVTDPTVTDPSSSSSAPRIARSESVSVSSSVPPPPPRRKRPESMQLTWGSERHWEGIGEGYGLPMPMAPHVLSGSGFGSGSGSGTVRTHGRTTSHQGLSRHLSLTRDRDTPEPSSDPHPSYPTHASHASASTIAHIQKTLTNLQQRAQPKLDAVRYKAEAGLSKRGYVPHPHPFHGNGNGNGNGVGNGNGNGVGWWRDEGEEGLMADARWTAANVDDGCVDSDPTSDNENEGEGGGRGPTTRGAPHRDFLTESDNLKWPMGQGWKPL